MKFEELNDKVIGWALDKNLTEEGNQFQQYAKFQEEAGELARAMLKKDKPEQEDSIGDILVTLCILSRQLDLDIVGCFFTAWNEIKNRKGKTVGGTFIKD